MWDPGSVVILSGSCGVHLAEEIAGIIGLPVSSTMRHSNVPGGEIKLQLSGNVRARHIFVVQSTSGHVNDSLIELALILSACKRASAHTVCAITPYLAYARQTMKAESRVPVSSADVATLLEQSCMDALVTVDIHDAQTAGFYSPRCAFHNSTYIPVAARFFVRHGLQSPVVVAPHASGVTRAMDFVRALCEYEGDMGMDETRTSIPGASTLGAAVASMGLGEQEGSHGNDSDGGGSGAGGRSRAGWTLPPTLAMLLTVERRGSKELELTGDVTGRDAIIIDDIIDTGMTIVRASRELIARGASRVFAFATHGVLSGMAPDKLLKAPVELIVVTNSVPDLSAKLPADHKLRRKIAILSVAPLLAHQVCELAGLPTPDLDPLVPTYALHSGVMAAPPEPPAYMMGLGSPSRGGPVASAAADPFNEESVSESMTTASEYSATY